MSAPSLRLKERIATGGMAEIHHAEKTLLPGVVRRVVAKRLLPDHRGDPELRAMLLDEARVLAQLHHPYVVELMGVEELEGEPVLVIEHVDGISLRHLFERLPGLGYPRVPLNAAATIALAIADALGYVHAASDSSGRPLGVIHRDLNPSNVLLARHGGTKIIDFGIALSDVRVCETATGTVKGTCGYMAPEQLNPGARVDHRTDLFSLGVLMYELFVGRHPFVTSSPLALYDLICSANYVPPAHSHPELPVSLATVIDQCLARDADARPRDAWAVSRLLCDALADAQVYPSFAAVAGIVAPCMP